MKYYLKTYKGNTNAHVSLDQPVSIKKIIGGITNNESIKNAEPLRDFDHLYFWDLGKRPKEHIKVGDKVYIRNKDYLYQGVIDVILSDPEGNIGDAIDWSRVFKNPFENPIGLKEVNRSDLTPELREVIERLISHPYTVAIDKPNNFYLIPREPSPDINQDNQREPQTQVEESIPVIEVESESSSGIKDDRATRPQETPNQLTINQNTLLSDLQKKIEFLKSSGQHNEREHESLVERFFEYLGYIYPTEIKYRFNHIDILINPDSPNSIVVEVKRDWSLSKLNTDVIDQAYRYANHAGSRFVVITNGDYYAFYDRYRGYSINDNFDFDFRLLSITETDIQLLKKYQKLSLE